MHSRRQGRGVELSAQASRPLSSQCQTVGGLREHGSTDGMRLSLCEVRGNAGLRTKKPTYGQYGNTRTTQTEQSATTATNSGAVHTRGDTPPPLEKAPGPTVCQRSTNSTEENRAICSPKIYRSVQCGPSPGAANGLSYSPCPAGHSSSHGAPHTKRNNHESTRKVNVRTKPPDRVTTIHRRSRENLCILQLRRLQ